MPERNSDECAFVTGFSFIRLANGLSFIRRKEAYSGPSTTGGSHQMRFSP